MSIRESNLSGICGQKREMCEVNVVVSRDSLPSNMYHQYHHVLYSSHGCWLFFIVQPDHFQEGSRIITSDHLTNESPWSPWQRNLSQLKTWFNFTVSEIPVPFQRYACASLTRAWTLACWPRCWSMLELGQQSYLPVSVCMPWDLSIRRIFNNIIPKNGPLTFHSFVQYAVTLSCRAVAVLCMGRSHRYRCLR